VAPGSVAGDQEVPLWAVDALDFSGDLCAAAVGIDRSCAMNPCACLLRVISG
jgi:hypothetical protein